MLCILQKKWSSPKPTGLTYVISKFLQYFTVLCLAHVHNCLQSPAHLSLLCISLLIGHQLLLCAARKVFHLVPPPCRPHPLLHSPPTIPGPQAVNVQHPIQTIITARTPSLLLTNWNNLLPKFLLENLDLTQSINEPIRRQGNTLDLVMSKGYGIVNDLVTDITVSDHRLMFDVLTHVCL